VASGTAIRKEKQSQIYNWSRLKFITKNLKGTKLITSLNDKYEFNNPVALTYKMLILDRSRVHRRRAKPNPKGSPEHC
jgi:hypothetical protein